MLAVSLHFNWLKSVFILATSFPPCCQRASRIIRELSDWKTWRCHAATTHPPFRPCSYVRAVTLRVRSSRAVSLQPPDQRRASVWGPATALRSGFVLLDALLRLRSTPSARRPQTEAYSPIWLTCYGFMGKASSLFMYFDKMVGSEFEKGLASMKSIVESAADKNDEGRRPSDEAITKSE